MTKRRPVDCALDICDGSGWIDVTDWPDSNQERCPCGQGKETPPVADGAGEMERAHTSARQP